MVDFGKDAYYVATFPHKSLWLVVSLWFFAISAPIYTFLSVLTMDDKEFELNFCQELKDLNFLKKLKIKTIRAFREVF